VRLIRAQPHAARVRWWPWAKFTIARALVIEEVTEEHDRTVEMIFCYSSVYSGM